MLGKNYSRVGLWLIPVVALAIAGCSKQSASTPSAAGNSNSPATPSRQCADRSGDGGLGIGHNPLQRQGSHSDCD